MAEVSAGQVARLAVLFERYHRPLFRYFVSMNGDREQAEDLVQEVFFRMLRYRTSYDPAQSFTAWMYQIARNAGVDQVRKRGAAQVVDIDTFTDRRAELVSASPGPEESASRGQDLALLRRAMDQLPEDKREILVLSRFQGMKHEDIAEVLGCEVGTVKVRVYRAIRALEQIYFALEKEKGIMNCEQARIQMLGETEGQGFRSAPGFVRVVQDRSRAHRRAVAESGSVAGGGAERQGARAVLRNAGGLSARVGIGRAARKPGFAGGKPQRRPRCWRRDWGSDTECAGAGSRPRKYRS